MTLPLTPAHAVPAFRISRPPQTLEELGVSLQLMETLQHDLPDLETQIPPIHEQFTILEKYEVPVQENVSFWGLPSTRVGPVAAAACGESQPPRRSPWAARRNGRKVSPAEGARS